MRIPERMSRSKRPRSCAAFRAWAASCSGAQPTGSSTRRSRRSRGSSCRQNRRRVKVAEPATMKWWGWGDPNRKIELPEAALDRLRSALGAERRRAEPVPLDSIALEEPRLPGKVVEQLESLLGQESLRRDRLAR